MVHTHSGVFYWKVYLNWYSDFQDTLSGEKTNTKQYVPHAPFCALGRENRNIDMYTGISLFLEKEKEKSKAETTEIWLPAGDEKVMEELEKWKVSKIYLSMPFV